MHESLHRGVRFIEGHPAVAAILGPIDVQIGGIIRSAQLRTLDDVKDLMVAQVQKLGGNAVVDFKYGQKSVGFLASIFQRDDVNWYGSGSAAFL